MILIRQSHPGTEVSTWGDNYIQILCRQPQHLAPGTDNQQIRMRRT